MSTVAVLAGMAVVLFTACALPVHTMLRDPSTGQVVNCTAMTMHPNVFTAIYNERQCAAGYRAAGYTCLQGNCQ